MILFLVERDKDAMVLKTGITPFRRQYPLLLSSFRPRLPPNAKVPRRPRRGTSRLLYSIVYIALLTPLVAYPGAAAIALMVSVVVTEIALLYFVEDVVGVVPLVV